ncbi:hypothetical protein EON62_01285, partial [archaeon]
MPVQKQQYKWVGGGTLRGAHNDVAALAKQQATSGGSIGRGYNRTPALGFAAALWCAVYPLLEPLWSTRQDVRTNHLPRSPPIWAAHLYPARCHTVSMPSASASLRAVLLSFGTVLAENDESVDVNTEREYNLAAAAAADDSLASASGEQVDKLLRAALESQANAVSHEMLR